jgi:predicted amidohydrolase
MLVRLFMTLCFWCSSAQGLQSLNMALVPYTIDGDHSYQSFEAKVLNQLRATLPAKPDLIVLPELISFDLISNQASGDVSQHVLDHAQYFDTYVRFIQKFAADNNIHIMAGSFQRYHQEKLFNTSIFVSAEGIVTLQDKLFITPWEKENGFSNGTELQLFSINGIMTVILNCHDVEFPMISHFLAKDRPELILVPSMTDDIHGFERVARTSMARAVEHMTFVVSVGVTSSEKGKWHQYYGSAALYSPQNAKLSRFEKRQKPNSLEALFVEIDISDLRQERERSSAIYPIRDQSQREEALIIQHAL